MTWSHSGRVLQQDLSIMDSTFAWSLHHSVACPDQQKPLWQHILGYKNVWQNSQNFSCNTWSPLSEDYIAQSNYSSLVKIKPTVIEIFLSEASMTTWKKSGSLQVFSQVFSFISDINHFISDSMNILTFLPCEYPS